MKQTETSFVRSVRSRRSATLPALVVAALSAAAAMADSATDSAIRMEETGIAVFGHADFEAPTAAYPTAASGTIADGANSSASATSSSMTWSLSAWSVGRTISEQPPDAKVGEFLTRFPREASEIDWDATFAAIRASQAASDGYVQIIGGTTNLNETLLVTRSGAMEIPFVLTNGERVSSLYTFSAATSTRPYRLFATRRDEGNSAPFVDLSGCFVRFFGDPAVITPRYQVTGSGGAATSNVVWGIDYDPATSHMLTARYTVDEATGTIDCPTGQFVLAYYDTETKEHLVASIVVEITPPAVNTLQATVGSELRPVGGGWNVAGLQGVVNGGAESDQNDPYAPYVERFAAPTGQELSNKYHGKIYAIAPTDKTTSGAMNMAMPWKADIYWKTADPMGVMWTFENDWYLISWPADTYRLVIADDPSKPGLKWAIPTNYTAQVLGYKAPDSLVVKMDSSSGEVTVGGEGKFLLKIMTAEQDVPWYLPMKSCNRTNPDVLASSNAGAIVADWPIGFEATMFTDAGAGTAEGAARLMDASLPGYIYQAASAGRNWNPRLYHEPSPDGVGDLSDDVMDAAGGAGGSSTDDDPFENLESAIYGVNESLNPVEVWWRGTIRLEGMEAPITYPGLVERYRFTWEETLRSGLLPDIVLSSKLGSADPTMTAFGGRSLLFFAKDAYASMRSSVPLIGVTNVVGFQVYSSDYALDMATGRVATVTLEGSTFAISLTETTGTNFVFTSELNGVPQDTVSIVRDGWSEVGFVLPAWWSGKKATLSLGAAGGVRSASGFELDDFAIWCQDAAGNTDDAVRFLFAETDLEPTPGDNAERTAADGSGHGYQLVTHGFSVAGRGSPRPFDGTLGSAAGVAPAIYYQNDRDGIGWNPNEEHAFLQLNGNYVVWAMRNDLNVADSSEPIVLVQFEKNGKGAMQAYRVVTTSPAYPDFSNTVVAGSRMIPPGPVGAREGSETTYNAYSSLYAFDDANVVYVDRKGAAWARRDGSAMALYAYPMADGFYCPSLGDNQLEVNTAVGWMNCVDIPNPSAENLKNVETAIPWNWFSVWPATNGVPTMKVAQVLTKATQGLPEVWNAASMAIAYPNPAASADTNAATVVDLIDPTVAQCAPLSIDGDFTGEYGFTLGSSGTCFLRKGKYYFTGLPPSISDRFYIDTNADVSRRMNLIGQLVEKESGGSYLELNVLTDAEREALKDICPITSDKKAEWDAAVDQLATSAVVPSVRASTEPYTVKCKSYFNYIFPSEKAKDKWIKLTETNSVPVLDGDGTHFAVTSTNGALYVDALTTPVAKMVITSNEWKRLHQPTKQAAAKMYYDMSGMSAILGDWEDERDYAIAGNKIPWIDAQYVQGYFEWESVESVPSTIYSPQDRYALVANGSGAGWVTLIENDNPDSSVVNPGLPVSMHVIRVEPKLYLDGIAVLTDPLNKLSEKLTLLYRTPLGEAANDYEFEWKYATPNADGTLETDKLSAAWNNRTAPSVIAGYTSLQLGETTSVQDFVNTYYSLRYRAKEGTLAYDTVGPDWSGWTDEQLAEGWVQRVLNSVTPFAQRVEDFYDNPSDIAFTMLEQIGGPYQGDVALNNDNLKEVGLLELYQTIFNKAESILVASGGENIDLSKQLILATTRMGEFYSLLGAEAYSDAKNPLIGSWTGEPTAAGVFCFANQVPTLLDEELALLRGRTSATQFPKLTAAPYFNRLLWNFSKGMTEGEVAYVNNYGIRARDGVMDVNCAAAQYPQGHGDAWGHYLSALTGYYRLLRNPYVDWTASMTEMLMDQTTINVDYQDEAKFADAAVKLAQVGLDAMSLTARKAYKENGGDLRSGYFDADKKEAFGYGEWATRTGMGAAYNWMVANAITPTTNEAAQAFVDLGLKRIDREQNGAQMKALCRTVETLQTTLGGFDGGLNPLGLSENAIPFDIDPDALAEKNSHFEQILGRAEKALANCKTVLDWANFYGSRLAQLQENETTAIDNAAGQELAYQNQLISIYGTPFAGDIGPGGTYPQGYDGPDLYNYNYMDLSVFGLEGGLQTVFTNSYPLYEAGLSGYWKMKMQTGYETDEEMAVTVNYIVNDGGIRMKPATVTGVRATEGTIQAAYRDYISAYQRLQAAMSDYEVKVVILQETFKATVEARVRLAATMGIMGVSMGYKYSGIREHIEHYVDLLDTDFNFLLMANEDQLAAVPHVFGAGMTAITDPSSIAQTAKLPALMSEATVTYSQLRAAKEIAYNARRVGEAIDGISDMMGQAWDLADTMRETKMNLETAANDINEAASAIQGALADLTSAETVYRAEIYRGQMLQEERELWRQQVSNRATQQRYLDMFNRIQRNNALVKYSTAFDTAQRYVFELAKVYDYETGLLSSDAQSGKQFLADIIATRSLGSEGLATSSGTTDGGLWDVVTRMKANWDVLKGRLGVNNPDKPEKWFSLRYELFRIKPDASGDEAWRRELRKYWVDDIFAESDFVRHCQPLQGENPTATKEPGLVIPFPTSINNAENFFGKTLQGGESQFSSADYATKIAAVGVDFVGYDRLTTQTTSGLATEPNIYLVPIGTDYMRAPAGMTRKVLGWTVVDQVMPLPYTIGSAQLDDEAWIATMSGLDGTSDSAATIRRHSTLRAGSDFTSTRLVGRSVWNDKWMLVIPASSLNADRDRALETFINGVGDIKLGIKAYSRQGN